MLIGAVAQQQLGFLGGSVEPPVEGDYLAVLWAGNEKGTYEDSSTTTSEAVPATAEEGDLLVALVMHRGTVTVVPSGWTLVVTESCVASGVTQYLSVYKKIASPTDASTLYTWTINSASRCSVAISCYRGTNVDVISSNTRSISNGSGAMVISYPDLTLPSEGTVLVAATTVITELTNGEWTTSQANTEQITQPVADGNRLGGFIFDAPAGAISGTLTNIASGNIGMAAVALFIGQDVTGAQEVGIYDNIQRPFEAVSVRKVNFLYSGPCMRVARISDSVEQDIGFDVNGLVDVAAIEGFDDGGGCVVSAWYRQYGGYGFDAVPIGLSSAPIISTAGVVELLNGLPVLDFTGATDRKLVMDAGASKSYDNLTISTVTEVSNSADDQWAISLGDFANMFLLRNNINDLGIGGRRQTTDTLVVDYVGDYSNQHIVATGKLDYINAEKYIYIDGVLENTNLAFQVAGSSVRTGFPMGIGGTTSDFSVGSNVYKGKFQEILIYDRPTDTFVEDVALDQVSYFVSGV